MNWEVVGRKGRLYFLGLSHLFQEEDGSDGSNKEGGVKTGSGGASCNNNNNNKRRAKFWLETIHENDSYLISNKKTNISLFGDDDDDNSTIGSLTIRIQQE